MVGAGLAGLGAAWQLARRGYDVTVLERAQRPGGRAAGERLDGFAVEACNPVVSTADRHLLGWIDAVGQRDELLPLRPVLPAQVHRDRVVEIEPRSLVGIARIPGVRWRDAARLLRLGRLMTRFGERLAPDAPESAAPVDDRSLADFGRLYFGPSLLERWLAPGVTGVALGDAGETSRALFLRRHRTHGGARLGVPRGAFGELAEAAASKLGVRYGVEAVGLEPRPDGALRLLLRGAPPGELEADAAVLAIPAPDAARVAGPVLASAERDALEGTRYLPALVLSVGLRRAFSLHPCEVRVPRDEGSPLETLLLEAGQRGGRAPEGRGLATLRATSAWSAARLEAPDEAIRKELLGEFSRWYPGAEGAVLFARLARVERALPHFGVGRYRALARLACVQGELRAAGRRVYLAGDYRAGPTADDALASAARTADEVAADLG